MLKHGFVAQHAATCDVRAHARFNPNAVATGPPTDARTKTFVGDRVEYDAGDRAAIARYGGTDGELRFVAKKSKSAVDWIDDERVARLQSGLVILRLLGEPAVVRAGFSEPFAQERVDGKIGLGDRAALVLLPAFVWTAEKSPRDVAGFANRLLQQYQVVGGIEIRPRQLSCLPRARSERWCRGEKRGRLLASSAEAS